MILTTSRIGGNMRRHFLLVLTAAMVAGCAQQAVRPAQQKTAQPRAFIDRSAIFYPKSGDKFDLIREYTYANVASGIQLTYEAEDLPSAKIDIFVYPVGDVPEDKALAIDMKDVQTGVEGMVRQGRYSEVQYGALSDFNVPLGKDSTLSGKRQLLTFDLDGTPMVSAAYLAYKQLYLFELRITSAAVTEQQLAPVGDRIATEAFRKIHILSEGKCASPTVEVGKNADQLRQSLMAAMKHVLAVSCTTEFQPGALKPGDNEDVTVLTFRPQDWN